MTNSDLAGLATVLAESVFAAMQSQGVRTVRWLVHPANVASVVAFSRETFPGADETQAPEDHP